MNEIILSVAIVTYNHEKYISKCIESIVSQKTNFKFEIVIGEDCSTDKTREIVKWFKGKYPEIISPIYNRENFGKKYKPSSGRGNYINVLKKCNGKYIAVCEGDDYWIDPLKLQKQIDYLESNHNYSACVHQVAVNYKSNDDQHVLFTKRPNKEVVIDNMLESSYFHASSWVFNKDLFNPLDYVGNDILLRDHPSFILCATKGKIGFLNEIMSVYMKNPYGLSSRISHKQIYEANLKMIDGLYTEIGKGFKWRRHYMIAHQCKVYIYNSDNLSSVEVYKLYFKFVISSFYIFPKNIPKILHLSYRLIFSGYPIK
jgi:glycosyltransferase involved in cell wall biosynthesis